MERFALLMIYGRDRPGIVARVTRVLYDTGCNIADSSMTRLRGEFTIMLILRLGEAVTAADLTARLQPVATALELGMHLEEMDRERAAPSQRPEGARECIVTVLGTDRPGIVYRVTRVMEEMEVNITDLVTRVLGSPQRPIYSMVIEAESVSGDLCPLADRLKALATELGVEISVRPGEVYVM